METTQDEKPVTNFHDLDLLCKLVFCSCGVFVAFIHRKTKIGPMP